MPKIYVANTSRQNFELNYRTPTEANPKTGRMMWSERLYVEKLPAGGHVVLANGKEFTDMEAKYIFEHQATCFGARRDGEHGKGFVGLIFSHQPIKLDNIEEAVQQNIGVAEDRSDKMLGATAASMLKSQSERAQETGAAVPKRVELEVAAETSRDIDVGGKGSEATQEGVEPRNRPVLSRRAG